MRHGGFAVLGLFIAASLAGCAGGEAATRASPTALTPAPPPAPTAETGSIEGVVTNEEALPVVGARVALDKGTNETTTDAEGKFVFNDVEPGLYKIFIEFLGYESVARQATVVAGEVASVKAVLRALEVVEAIIEMTPFKGMIQCSVNPVYALNPCDGVTGEDTSTFPFKINLNWTWKEAVFELVWTPTTSATAKELELDVCEFVPDGTHELICWDSGQYYQYKTDPSPIVIRVTDMPWKKDLNYIVGAGGGQTSPYPTFQQPFDIYMTHCYYVECPEDYSAIPT